MDRRSEKESNVYHGPVAIICSLMAAALLPAACAEIPDTCGNTSAAGSGLAGPAACQTELVIGTGDYRTRSSAPDEMQLTDFNIFIFNADGLLEEHVYTDISQMHSNDDGDWTYGFRLLKGCRYAIYVCANTGFRLSCRNLSELLDYRFYMAYPDEYRIGMLMSGTKYIEFLGEEEIRVGLKRAMAKISVGIDRSALDDDVEFNVIRARIGQDRKLSQKRQAFRGQQPRQRQRGLRIRLQHKRHPDRQAEQQCIRTNERRSQPVHVRKPAGKSSWICRRIR